MRKVEPRIVKRKIWDPVVSDSSPKGKVKTEKVYPTVSIPLEHLPEAKDWELKKTYEVTLKLRMKALSMTKRDELSDFDKDYGNKAEFDIVGIDVEEGEEETDERAPRYKEDEEE